MSGMSTPIVPPAAPGTMGGLLDRWRGLLTPVLCRVWHHLLIPAAVPCVCRAWRDISQSGPGQRVLDGCWERAVAAQAYSRDAGWPSGTRRLEVDDDHNALLSAMNACKPGHRRLYVLAARLDAWRERGRVVFHDPAFVSTAGLAAEADAAAVAATEAAKAVADDVEIEGTAEAVKAAADAAAAAEAAGAAAEVAFAAAAAAAATSSSSSSSSASSSSSSSSPSLPQRPDLVHHQWPHPLTTGYDGRPLPHTSVTALARIPTASSASASPNGIGGDVVSGHEDGRIYRWIEEPSRAGGRDEDGEKEEEERMEGMKESEVVNQARGELFARHDRSITRVWSDSCKLISCDAGGTVNVHRLNPSSSSSSSSFSSSAKHSHRHRHRHSHNIIRTFPHTSAVVDIAVSDPFVFIAAGTSVYQHDLYGGRDASFVRK